MKHLYTEDEVNDLTNQLLNILFRNNSTLFIRHNSFDFANSFPTDIQSYFNDLIIHDLRELGNCVQYKLWTAASLMSFRIFEQVVMIHVSVDLKVSIDKLTLGKAMNHLTKSFNKDFVKQLRKIQQLRNLGMHPEHIFTREETIEITDIILWMVLYIHSIVE